MTPNPASYFRTFMAMPQSTHLPTQFTYPFCYEPHPLSIAAAEQLQHELMTSQAWEEHLALQTEADAAGKMFGVLVVKNTSGELGFLAAFSGKLANANHHQGFVPPVYDILNQDNVFLDESNEINQLNLDIEQLETNPKLAEMTQDLEQVRLQAEFAIKTLQSSMIETRKQRKIQRKQAVETLSDIDCEILYAELAKQSVEEKRYLAEQKLYWQQQITMRQNKLEQFTVLIEEKKTLRKQRSHALQHQLFSNYRFLNARGEEAVLIDLFKDSFSPIPPAGSGECAAPKLLQFAYQHQLEPISMAEFWWEKSPKSAIRKHKKYYPACSSKCLPILSHMLKGLDVEFNPLLSSPANNKDIEIIYQDEAIIVISKPEEMLSVPGVYIQDSAFTRIRKLLADQGIDAQDEGPFVVHRLDMSTSGLLVFALTRRANKSLQKQFITRHVAKRYIAEIEGTLGKKSGYIHLPLAPDQDDKPRQMVCDKSGKTAETYWEVIEQQDSRTTLYLHPKTGRTHQLRVHCAHPLGLNSPIVGDDLYGDKADRLHLHAEMLRFDHPYTKERMTFQSTPNFI
jgi:tRNA pseudouridine32 synthase / 23S rRNA pseudouridine746 synthase